jgi:hypothetical protein
MSERPVPEEYTQTRAEFGKRAIETARAVKSILGGLIEGYAVLNNIVPPAHGTNPSGQGGTTSTTQEKEENKERTGFDSHDPYFLHDAIKALDVLIEFTEKRYL